MFRYPRAEWLVERLQSSNRGVIINRESEVCIPGMVTREERKTTGGMKDVYKVAVQKDVTYHC